MLTDLQIRRGFEKIARDLETLNQDTSNPYSGMFRDGILKAIEDLGLMKEFNKFLKEKSK